MNEAAKNVEDADRLRGWGWTSVGSTRQAWVLWGTASALVFLVLFCFYPKTVVVTDEGCYLSVAGHLLSGKAWDQSSEAWFWKETRRDVYERALFSASPTFSALLVPFVAAGWRSCFLLGTIAHVLAFGGMIYVLRRRGLSPLWALLYLLYPTGILYSRTAMGDVVSAAMVVLMLVVLHRERPNYFAAGLVMGFALLLKLSNLPVVGSFALVTFLGDVTARRKDPKGMEGTCGREAGGSASRFRWFWMGLGMLPGLALFAKVNTVFFNGPLGNGYVGLAEGYFRWGCFAEHFSFYVVCLMTLYPGMLVSLAFLRGRYRWEMGISCLGALVFFSFYYFMDQGNNWYESMVRGLRFHLVVLPFYILGYGTMVTAVLRRIPWKRVVSAGLAAGMLLVGAGDVATSVEHSRHAAREWERQRQLGTLFPSSGKIVTCLAAAKYVNAAVYPELPILRSFDPCDVPFAVRGATLPAFLVLMDPAGIRTKAYREVVPAENDEVLRLAREFYEVRRCERQVEGFECWVLVRRIVPPKPIWRPLPLDWSFGGERGTGG